MGGGNATLEGIMSSSTVKAGDACGAAVLTVLFGVTFRASPNEDALLVGVDGPVSLSVFSGTVERVLPGDICIHGVESNVSCVCGATALASLW